jgi:hypothetical protein
MYDVSATTWTCGAFIDFQQEACTRYPNVEAIAAYMPEPFGTHHSKMMVLLRHDDLAQYEMKSTM